MKIGILTSSIAGNYGGILQNYALQQVLKAIGHQPITIDHYKSYSRIRWIMGRLKSFSKGKKQIVPFPWYGRIGKKKILDFAFKNILRTKPTKRISPAIIDQYGFNALVVGSDQVWRRRYNRNLETSFLSFAENKNIKRIAYAASFGVEQWDYPNDVTVRCGELLAKFDAVSVREKSDVALCSDNLNIKPVHVLDPTLLLEGSHYEKFFIKKDIIKKKYLFAYVLDINKEILSFIEKTSNDMHLSPVIMGAENNAKDDDGIEKWLTFLSHASFVITDSYHGTLFSINFKRDFLVINNKQRGSSRFYSILNILGILDRLIEINDIYKVPKSINWETVYDILNSERIKSIDFLKSSF